MRMCGEIIGFLLLSCKYMTQKRARGRLRAVSAILQGQWGYTTMSGGVFWWNGKKRLRTLGNGSRNQVRSFLGRYILCKFYMLYMWMHISDIKIHILHITCLYAYDKQSGEGSCSCHGCYAKRSDFLSDVDAELKTVEKCKGRLKKRLLVRISQKSFVVAAMTLW